MSSRFFCSGYYNLDAWVLAHCIAIFTRRFCEHFLTSQNDPKGRLYDQMYMAARSVYANIAEGSARHNTSTETEMRLTDVARGSAIELSEDFMQLIIEQNGELWQANNPVMQALQQVPFIHTDYEENNWSHDAAERIKKQVALFDPLVMTDNMLDCANALFVLCRKQVQMLSRLIDKQFEEFTQNGGFTESLTQARLEHRQQEALSANAPVCPKCGKPMLQRMIKKGTKQGQTFWGCSDYPRCDGTRD